MPLPADGTVHLTRYSRPGETSQSRPKQAMILRMSDKTLDLLEHMPQLQFDFSDNPGLTIGDTFFPVTSVQETSPHDLYLRASSAAKRNAPLKLYANITGKFAVERQLDDRITDKLRASAADAQNQRAGRTTIFVETPTDLPPPNGKKKKDATMFRKPVRPTDQPRRPAPASAAGSSGGASPTPPQPQRSKEALQALRSRMIRCIAVCERTSDQVVKLVGGNDSSASMKRDILDLLEEIAEPVPLPNNSKAPKNYRLKTKSWLEVRPYEIPGLSESDRTTMARSAKLALRDLKIPESDPAWSHVQYRNPNVAQGSEAPKRGLTSASAKEKKATKTRDSGEIMMKNESLKASSSRPSTSSSTRDDEPSRALSSKPPATRPRPGSGFKAKQPTPTESREFTSGRSPVINGKAILGESPSSTPDPRHQTSQASDRRVPTQRIEKLRRDDVAASDSERSDLVRKRERALKAKEREREREDRERDKRDHETGRERERERDRERDRRDIEKQRERERAKRREAEFESDRERERARKKARDREWSREREREEGERSDDGFRPSKRKKIPEDDDYEGSSRTSMKKRKMESPPPRSTKPRDLSLPKKPEVDLPPRPKAIKKESSPFAVPKVPKESSPLPKIKKEPITKMPAPPTKTSSTSTSSSQVPSNSKSKPKRRRPEDIYTSSEDEGEIRPPIKREPAPVTIPTTNNNHRNEISSHSRSQNSKLPPTHDYTALRAHYDSSYLPYLGNFQKLMKHKTKVRNMLKKMEKGSTGSVTESDGDGELLDPEELKKLALEYHNQHEDLETIQRIFSRRE